MEAYDALCSGFRWDVPEHYNFAVDTIGMWASDPQRLAMIHLSKDGVERRITFAEFAARSDRVAAALRAQGVGPGDRVMVILPRVPEWYETMLALMKLGAIAIPGTTLLTARDLLYRIESSGAKGVVIDNDVADRIDQIAEFCPSLAVQVSFGGARHEPWQDFGRIVAAAPAEFTPEPTRSDAPFLIYFTSGTTAHPKMVLHPHSYPLGHLVTGHMWRETPQDAAIWAISDGGWAFAAWFFFGVWNQGKALFIHDFRGRMDPVGMLTNLATYPIAAFAAPPTVYRMFILQDLSAYSFPALQLAISAGEPLNPEVIETWETSTGVPMREMYGQTESVALLANFPPLPVRPGSTGKPTPGHYVAVIDDEGNELPPGEEGHIAVKLGASRPYGLFHGYWGDPDMTAERLHGDWYMTGDRAQKDEDGYFWFIGRSDDVIKSSGYRISPFEIESVLIEHVAVAESAVVASPDPVRGEIVKAFVILAPGYEPSDALAADIQAFVQKQTAPYKYPREIEFVAELPKTISGKIRRVELREREVQRKRQQAD
ncbi:MAG: acyl-CoA synthetase [Chloroflexi bacterium]|nr:MAG: acyl-CoA synthetase [Chloroflexota bacterium]